MKKYEFKEHRPSGIFSAPNTTERMIINDYARRGYRYVGKIPTQVGSYGYIKTYDLVFELDTDEE